MKSDKKRVIIPLDKIDEGIKLCLDNASQFCNDADVLLGRESSRHALGLCILAVEELGKVAMLKDEATCAQKRSEEAAVFEPGKFKEFTKREVNPFYDHLSKLIFAGKYMEMASFERSMKSQDGRWFQTIYEFFEKVDELQKQNQEVNTDLRELVFYVDYNQKDGSWSKGIQVDSARLRALISDIRNSIRLIAS